MGSLKFLSVSPAKPAGTKHSSIVPSKTQAAFRVAIQYATTALGAFCAFLVAVDIVGNNWELNHFVGDAKHLFTPLLNIYNASQLLESFAFPAAWSPDAVSNVGRFMVTTTIDRVHDDTSTFYHLTLSQHLVQNAANDICGTLAKTYAIPNASIGANVNLGTIQDQITCIRGNAITHMFGSTMTDPKAALGDNYTTLSEMGYVPGRVGLDMRLTTAIQVPPPGQLITTNVTMYTYFSKGFCSGCRPGMEMGMDTCAIVYSYNDTTNALVVRSSHAYVGSYHVLGFSFYRRWGALTSIIIRSLCVLMALSAFASSEKTVRWTDPLMLTSWFKRIKHMLAPKHYRHTNHAFKFVYFCFNSDLFVLLYSAAILMDEDIAMVYARVMNRWAKPAGFNIWTTLRLWALGLRWLWFNLALLKLLKWLCNFVSTVRFNGGNKIMGLLNFSSLSCVYLTVFALFDRTDYIEYGNSVNFVLTSATEDLDEVYVEFGDSWYVRGLPSLLALMLANLLLVLMVDHVVYRTWWQLLAKNTLGRQHMFNSTSILSDMSLPVEHGDLYSTITVNARTLCTFQWFFTGHLTCFGLPEDPDFVRKFVSSKLATSRMNTAKHPSIDAKQQEVGEMVALVDTNQVAKDEAALANAAAVADAAIHMIVQDQDGYWHLYDSEKHEVQALGMEVKILRNAAYRLG
ncbi:Aste57867_10182 [Aphanomyces stellatus]|uniref:Aste57867_10182 protein n=1 Tax=Aphanomyces stellatus TaxID=120398 RepID=A0A485KQ84_9STRA|nr:hypothetical protein As57867_010143 [Aphanomyces stellatus]VFT87058.1 Aste57867_10182 [Aphanomyces stellatus]